MNFHIFYLAFYYWLDGTPSLDLSTELAVYTKLTLPWLVEHQWLKVAIVFLSQ